MKKKIAALTAGLLALGVAAPATAQTATGNGLPGVLNGQQITPGVAAGIGAGVLFLGIVLSDNNASGTTTTTTTP
jgi:hypothetical protein